MRNDTRAVQVRQIVQELASLPGGMAVEITAKKLPRFGPADLDSPYQVSTRVFTVQEIPESVSVPHDTDEVIIRLRGALGEPKAKAGLVDELHTFFSSPDLQDQWDLRTHFKNGSDPRPAYELTVFSHVPPAVPEKLA